MRCPACFDIPRFPLIFSCGHLDCHNCYSCDIKMRARRRGGIFFSTCFVCRAEVRPEVVLTATREIEQHPNFIVSKFYNGLLVLCSNLAFNQYTSYFQLTQHIIFQCRQRDIFCKAETFPTLVIRKALSLTQLTVLLIKSIVIDVILNGLSPSMATTASKLFKQSF